MSWLAGIINSLCLAQEINTSLTLLGDGLALGQDIQAGLTKLHQKHGCLVGFLIGKSPFVSISDFDMLQKTLTKDEFSGRLRSSGLEIYRRDDGVIGRGNTSLAMGDCAQWKRMHRTTLRQAKNRERDRISK